MIFDETYVLVFNKNIILAIISGGVRNFTKGVQMLRFEHVKIL